MGIEILHKKRYAEIIIDKCDYFKHLVLYILE